MSGMAGNVTAFNTVWTYDLYQAYIAQNKSDEHYMWMGRSITVVGHPAEHRLRLPRQPLVHNAMDIIQLVFGFVNAPLFATFLLGMFWKRTTSTGAFFGLLGGTLTSALFHSLTLAAATPRHQGRLPRGRSTSSPAKWPRTSGWPASPSRLLRPDAGDLPGDRRTKTDEELKGLVYSLTPKLKDEEDGLVFAPGGARASSCSGCVVLNVIFW